jgi:S-(hydroxymethyl)glutathione dehydrogenase / alcohol dehydrogenase
MTRTPVRAAVLREPGQALALEELFLDTPLAGEVRIRTHAVGLCHSDLHYVQGKLPISMPAVLGHEVVGEVEQVGPDCTTLYVGDRVVITITPSCGMCALCLSGRSTLCQNAAQSRQRSRPKLIDAQQNEVNLLGAIGAFAEAFIVHERAAVRLESDMSAAEACLLGCCVATGFGAVVHGAAVSPLDTVAVIGCGGVGIAAIQAARIAGARKVIAIDLFDEKLDRAEALGATHRIRSGPDVLADLELIAPGGVDKSFEAVGSPATAALAFEILAPSGVATILGLQPSGNTIEINAEKVIEGDRKITGAYMGSNQLSKDMPAFIDHQARGTLRLKDMVTSCWAFEDINRGFDAMADPTSIRAVVEF